MIKHFATADQAAAFYAARTGATLRGARIIGFAGTPLARGWPQYIEALGRMGALYRDTMPRRRAGQAHVGWSALLNPQPGAVHFWDRKSQATGCGLPDVAHVRLTDEASRITCSACVLRTGQKTHAANPDGLALCGMVGAHCCDDAYAPSCSKCDALIYRTAKHAPTSLVRAYMACFKLRLRNETVLHDQWGARVAIRGQVAFHLVKSGLVQVEPAHVGAAIAYGRPINCQGRADFRFLPAPQVQAGLQMEAA